MHSKKALDVRIGRPFTKLIVRWDWTKHSDKAQGLSCRVLVARRDRDFLGGAHRILIPALRAFARWSLVPQVHRRPLAVCATIFRCNGSGKAAAERGSVQHRITTST